MKNLTVKARTTMMGLRFLLAPEDSSASPSEDNQPFAADYWNGVKTLLWLVISVLAALLVGRM